MKINPPEELYRDGVNILLEDPAGRIALQLRDNQPGVSFGGLWGLFGGWLEPGETPQQAVLREVMEELTIALDPARLVYLGVYWMHVVRARDFIFRYPITDELDHARLNEGEAFLLMSRPELRSVPMVPHHLDLLTWVWSQPGAS